MNHSSGASYWTAWYVEIIAMCSVDIFAIVSGYFGYGKHEQKSYRLFELLSVVVFYSLLITIVFLIFKPVFFDSAKAIIKSFFPPLDGKYWYITCFVPILILQPLLNRMIDSLTDKQHGLLIGLLFVVFSIIPSIVQYDFFLLRSGYSCVWLLICYIIGAYLQRAEIYQRAKQHKALMILIFFVLSLLLLFGDILLEFLFNRGDYMVAYVSPVIILMSIAFIAVFDGLKVAKGRKMILFLSTVSFDVFIIHSHIMIYKYYLTDAFKWVSDLNILLIPFLVVAIAAGIYLVCSAISFVRMKIYHLLRIERLLNRISTRYDDFINKMIE